MSKTSAPGFPVEVFVVEHRKVVTRDMGDDPIYAFTFAPDTVNDGIFCDSPGRRPGSIAWGMSLKPVLRVPAEDYQESAIYVETTGEELRLLIACLQNLYDVNYDSNGNLKEA